MGNDERCVVIMCSLVVYVVLSESISHVYYRLSENVSSCGPGVI